MKACFYAFVLQLPRYLKIRWCNIEYFQTFVLQLSRYMKIRWIHMKIYFHEFSKWCDLTHLCLHLDGGGILELFYLYTKIPDSFGRWRNFGSILFVLKIPDIFLGWRNFGSILFVLQNSWHFWTVEEFWNYFVCTNQY